MEYTYTAKLNISSQTDYSLQRIMYNVQLTSNGFRNFLFALVY